MHNQLLLIKQMYILVLYYNTKSRPCTIDPGAHNIYGCIRVIAKIMKYSKIVVIGKRIIPPPPGAMYFFSGAGGLGLACQGFWDESVPTLLHIKIDTSCPYCVFI